MVANSRAKTNDDTEGLVKFLVDKETDKILGCHIVRYSPAARSRSFMCIQRLILPH